MHDIGAVHVCICIIYNSVHSKFEKIYFPYCVFFNVCLACQSIRMDIIYCFSSLLSDVVFVTSNYNIIFNLHNNIQKHAVQDCLRNQSGVCMLTQCYIHWPHNYSIIISMYLTGYITP